MPYSEILQFDSVVLGLKIHDQKQLFQKISKHISRIFGGSETTLTKNFLDEEKKHSSSLGNGVSVTHATLPNITKPLTIFIQLSDPVDFTMSDQQPVDMMCVLLMPEHEQSSALSRLSHIARFLNNAQLLSDLRAATSTAEINNIMYLNSALKKKAA